MTRLQRFRKTQKPVRPSRLPLDGLELVPGMPVDAFIQTGERSPLTFLTKPFTDYFTKAFRED